MTSITPATSPPVIGESIRRPCAGTDFRLAITTADDRYQEAATCFASLGLTPVALACVRARPALAMVLIEARRLARDADLVVLSSRRTLELVWGDQAPPAPVAAVGERTAEAVRIRGGTVSAVGNGGIGALIDLIGDDVGSLAVLYPHAAGTDRAAVEKLAGLAGRLTAIEVYATVPIPPGSDQVDGVSFASASAVRGWRLIRSLAGLLVGAIGASTEAAVAEIRPPDILADTPSFQALAEAFVNRLAVEV